MLVHSSVFNKSLNFQLGEDAECCEHFVDTFRRQQPQEVCGLRPVMVLTPETSLLIHLPCPQVPLLP